MRHGGYAEEDARLRGRAERLAEELRQSERRNRQEMGGKRGTRWRIYRDFMGICRWFNGDLVVILSHLMGLMGDFMRIYRG